MKLSRLLIWLQRNQRYIPYMDFKLFSFQMILLSLYIHIRYVWTWANKQSRGIELRIIHLHQTYVLPLESTEINYENIWEIMCADMCVCVQALECGRTSAKDRDGKLPNAIDFGYEYPLE